MGWTRRKNGPRPNVRRKTTRPPGLIGRRWRTARGKPGLGWLLLSAAGLVILGWGGVVAYERAEPVLREWLEIREVTVTGIKQVTRAEVLERLALEPGEPQWSVHPQALAANLEAHPWIKQAAVSRSLPHGLAVAIVERQPAAVLRTPAMQFLLDGEGFVLTVLSPGEDSDLPILVGMEPEGLMRGEEQARRAAQTGIKLARLLEPEFPDRPEVDLGNPDNAVAYVAGLRFHFGSSPFEEKWDRYRKIDQARQVDQGADSNGVARCGRSVAFDPLLAKSNGSPGNESPGDGCPEVDLRYPGKVILRERG